MPTLKRACYLILAAASISISISISGCGVLIGNVKPVEEKSESYRVLNLAERDADWIQLPPQAIADAAVNDGKAPSTDISDVAFQSKSTASIISLNSACRPSLESSTESLRSFTRELLLGISDITQQSEQLTKVQEVPALATTLEGKLNNEPVKLRTVVLRDGTCLYDLMYVSRPEHFATQEATFKSFVDSLRLRK